MKKTYEKPGLIVESFALSQSIATSCGYTHGASSIGRPTYADQSGCGWADTTGTTWTSSNNGCNLIADADFDLTVNCYNAPFPNFTVFAS